MTEDKEVHPFQLKRKDFGSDFFWGVSTAAYQIEGAHDLHGKGKSIWDTFTNNKGNIFEDQNGNTACDFYHRYSEDLQMMSEMHIPNFRFSLAWPRIIPEGIGRVSNSGLDFYDRLIDGCLERGIEPWVTLYHWDLPQALEDKGGWTNRDILGWFEEYAYCCAKRFGDRVKHWMVLNEPMVFTGAGYFLGVHAPGRKGLKNFLPAVHHAVLCQAEAGRILKGTIKSAEVGSTFSCSYITPFTNSKRDQKAAVRADALLNRLFVEPSLGLGYPVDSLPILRQMEPLIKADDQNKVIFDFDFVGVQNYTREVVKYSCFTPYLSSKIVKATERSVKTTLMDWEVYPLAIYEMLAKFGAYSGIKKIIVTENGAAFEDQFRNGKVNDPERLAYLKEHISQVYRAMQDGYKVGGYFIWTLMDNFEWAEGFYPRFGIVYTDYKTQQRIVKQSGQWYANFLKVCQ